MKFTATIFVALWSTRAASPVAAQNAGDVLGPAGVGPFAQHRADADLTVGGQRSY